jgi:hypothetical protein
VDTTIALLGAVMLSALVVPFTAFAWLRRHPEEEIAVPAPPDEPSTVDVDEADL